MALELERGAIEVEHRRRRDASWIHLETAHRLEVEAARSVVVEDALSGVEAGRRGGFGLVIGVDRLGHAAELAKAGADVVADDLAEVSVTG